MTVPWSFTMVVSDNRIEDCKKYREIACCFDGRGNAAVRCDAHCLMEHINGYTGSHWMPPSGECLHHITPVAAMVIEIGGKQKNTTKTQLLASNYGTNQSLVAYENYSAH